MAKFQILFVTVCVLSANSQLPTTTETPNGTGGQATNSAAASTSSPVQIPPVSCENEFKLKCSDCRNVAICAGSPQPINIISCANSPATPYCNNGACSAIRSANLTCENNSDLICSGEGYFPHPSDCSKYFLCDNKGGNAIEYSCGFNRVYDTKSGGCMTKTRADQCHIIDCLKNSNAFVRYAPNFAFYAFCSVSQTGAKKTIVYKCDNEEYSVFNLQTFACEFKCPKEGRFKTNDPTSFYECWKSGTVLISELWTCPKGYKFDDKSNRCQRPISRRTPSSGRVLALKNIAPAMSWVQFSHNA